MGSHGQFVASRPAHRHRILGGAARGHLAVDGAGRRARRSRAAAGRPAVLDRVRGDRRGAARLGRADLHPLPPRPRGGADRDQPRRGHEKVVVGPYGSGTELVFGIRVGGQEFRLGPGGRNPDGIPHAVVDFGAGRLRGRRLRGPLRRRRPRLRRQQVPVLRRHRARGPGGPGGAADARPDRAAGARAPAPTSRSTRARTVTLDGSGSRASTKPALQAVRAAGHPPRWDVARRRARRPRRGGAAASGVAGLRRRRPGPRSDQTPPSPTSSTSPAAPATPAARAATSTATAVPTPCSTASSLPPSSCTRRSRPPGPSTRSPSSPSAPARAPSTSTRRQPTATLVSPTADKDGNGVPDVVQAIKRVGGSGGTNFIPPVRASCQLLATTGSPNLVTAFMSDGQGSGSLKTVLPCNPPVTFHAFAVGSGSQLQPAGRPSAAGSSTWPRSAAARAPTSPTRPTCPTSSRRSSAAG